MGCRGIGLDFSILRQGLSIGREFGLLSLEEFARLGSLLEHAFYVPGSLSAGPDGVGFSLANPPLRIGAFVALRILWDGEPVPPERCTVTTGTTEPAVRFDRIAPANPLRLVPGSSSTYALAIGSPAEGRHRVRLELRNAAIPPVVWIEFVDAVHRAVPA